MLKCIFINGLLYIILDKHGTGFFLVLASKRFDATVGLLWCNSVLNPLNYLTFINCLDPRMFDRDILFSVVDRETNKMKEKKSDQKLLMTLIFSSQSH